jgi:hypothetical protein
MVNCPKCGFSQDQDQYCANCGIDMLAYRPAPKPLIQRLVSNITLQLCFLGVVVASVFLIVRHQQKIALAARVADVDSKAPTQIIERNEAPAREQAASSASAPESAPIEENESTSASSIAAAPAEPVAALASATSPQQPAPASVAPAGAAPDAAAESAAPIAAPSPATSAAIRMSFQEVPRAFLVELASESGANSGSYGSIHYGIAGDWTNRAKTFQGVVNWRSLDATTPQTLKVGEVTSVFRGPRDEATGQTIGVWIFAKLVRMDESSITMSFEVSRNLPSPTATGGVEQVNRLPLPEMTIPRGSAAFISGLVPHRQGQLSATEVRLYRADRVLQIMTSEPFRASSTDLAVFVEPSAAKPSAPPPAVEPAAAEPR